MIITSKNNKLVSLIKKLSQKKYREETGLFVAEGLRTVQDIVSFAPHLVDTIVVAESKSQLFADAVIVSDSIFEGLTETVNNQGVLALMKIPQGEPSGSDYALLLDGIRDPGNLGTLIRTACAAGYYDIYLRDCADAYSGKVVRSTMSAIVKVNIITDVDLSTIQGLKSKGYSIIGADMNGRNLFNTSFGNKICVTVGGEAFGISKEVRELCDEVISIPMEGDIESLNAGVSGAIIMYNAKFLKK